MMKCKSCSKEIESSIEADPKYFDVYCPECGKKQADLIIFDLYLGDKKKKRKEKKDEK